MGSRQKHAGTTINFHKSFGIRVHPRHPPEARSLRGMFAIEKPKRVSERKCLFSEAISAEEKNLCFISDSRD